MTLMNEFGKTDNPLNISWLEDPTESAQQSTTTHPSPIESIPTSYSTVSDRDYEGITLMRLRQAQERKRLIEEMENEDNQ